MMMLKMPQTKTIDILLLLGYNVIMKINKCLRCNYEWEQRITNEPRQCPRCKSPSWNKPKVRI